MLLALSELGLAIIATFTSKYCLEVLFDEANFRRDSACGGFRGGPVQDDNAHNNLGKQGWNDVTSSFVCFLK